MPTWKGVGLLRQLNSSMKWQRHVALHDLSLDSNGWSVELSSDSGKCPCVLRNIGEYKGEAELVKLRFVVLTYSGREDGYNVVAFDFRAPNKVIGSGEYEMNARMEAESAAREFEKGMSMHRPKDSAALSNHIPDNFTSVVSSLAHKGVRSVMPSLTCEGGTSLTESMVSQSNPIPSNFASIMSSLLNKGITSVMSSLAHEGRVSENPAVQEYIKLLLRDPDFVKFVAEVDIFVDKEELFVS